MPIQNPNNRGNVYIKHYEKAGLYLYTRDNGPALPSLLKDALIKAKGRWGDTPTLTRMIFSEMTKSDPEGTNSFGISTHLGDNENFILVVDDKKLLVGIFGESGKEFARYTFEQFIALQPGNLTFGRLTGGLSLADDSQSPNRRKTDPYPMETPQSLGSMGQATARVPATSANTVSGINGFSGLFGNNTDDPYDDPSEPSF